MHVQIYSTPLHVSVNYFDNNQADTKSKEKMEISMALALCLC